MRYPKLNLLAGLFALASAQGQVLTLDDAVRLALDHNRPVEQASLAAKSAAEGIAAARTQRLPSFNLSTTTGMLLTRPTITFEKGAFGEYPGIGPIPGDTTQISSARKPTTMIEAQLIMPLTQQIRIGLNIRQLELSKK